MEVCKLCDHNVIIECSGGCFSPHNTPPCFRQAMESQLIVAQQLKDKIEFTGCGDHGCLCIKPTGMGTNSGCRCHELHPKKAIMFLVNRIHEVERKIVKFCDICGKPMTLRLGEYDCYNCHFTSERKIIQ